MEGDKIYYALAANANVCRGGQMNVRENIFPESGLTQVISLNIIASITVCAVCN
jgi:hypothetical protein